MSCEVQAKRGGRIHLSAYFLLLIISGPTYVDLGPMLTKLAARDIIFID